MRLRNQPRPDERASPRFVSDASRYEAIAGKDPRAEGVFVYAVTTTGVYCRPSCAARLARPHNVRYFASPDAAEAAGFRACKRCRPRAPSAAEVQQRVIADACAYIRTLVESGDTAITLAHLAATAGLSPFHFQRVFKRTTGSTPRQYAAALRLQRFGDALRDGTAVAPALFKAGYSSSSRFYEGANALGMSPAQLRRGGTGVSMRALVQPGSLGLMLMAVSPRGVCAVIFGDDAESLWAELASRFPRATIERANATDEGLSSLARRIVQLADGGNRPADMPLDLMGTAFQQRVWLALREIPPGQTVTYAELARRIGAPRAVRAVGTACGANPVAVLVPCHRVIRGDGALGGYRWGLSRKKALLEREKNGGDRSD